MVSNHQHSVDICRYYTQSLIEIVLSNLNDTDVRFILLCYRSDKERQFLSSIEFNNLLIDCSLDVVSPIPYKIEVSDILDPFQILSYEVL